MKKLLPFFIFLSCTQFLFSQRNPIAWHHGIITMNNGTAGDLEMDTNILTSGFKNLHVVVTSGGNNEFKFDRDKFDIVTINDFKLLYSVKSSFTGRTAHFTLYLYSNNLIIYKKDYSIMFDGTLHPKLIMES